MAAASRSSPKKSRSNHKFLNTSATERPRNGLGMSNPIFFARRWFMNRLTKSGIKKTGKMMAQIPYPQRHEIVFIMLLPISGPAQTVHRNGMSKSVENKARLSKSDVSATKIWVSIWMPLKPADQKICALAKVRTLADEA
jgi:hypothetical protein